MSSSISETQWEGECRDGNNQEGLWSLQEEPCSFIASQGLFGGRTSTVDRHGSDVGCNACAGVCVAYDVKVVIADGSCCWKKIALLLLRLLFPVAVADGGNGDEDTASPA